MSGDGHAAPAEGGHGSGGFGSNFLHNISGKAKAKGKELGNQAYEKFNKWNTPTAEEKPTVMGNFAEVGMDMYRGTIDNVGRQFIKGGEEVLDSTRSEFQAITNIVQSPLYRVDKIAIDTAKAALETVNESAHLAKEVVARPLATIETGINEGFNTIDHVVHGTRKLMGHIPVIGGILQIGTGIVTAPITIGTKLFRLPVKGVSAVGNFIGDKLDSATNKVRDIALGNSGGHKEAPAPDNVIPSPDKRKTVTNDAQ